MLNIPDKELEILKFWADNKIFEKSVNKEAPHGDYVFYDGPPFATGLPHYGHILSSVIKDVVPRYWTMKGYHVRRRWGWDCHGLPIESLIEKELKISGKKQIETMGVDKFNEACHSKVLLYTQEWKKMVDRIGRWVEFDNAYKTMDPTYMESVWWALKTIWDKGLIYEGRKVLMYCPRCETPVSKAEIAMDDSYKDITEETVTIKFKVKDPRKSNLPENTFILAWTTTPWTLPGNVALAVGENIDYVLIKSGDEYLILAQARLSAVIKDNYELIKTIKGEELLGLEYEPLFNIDAINKTGKKAWYVTSADFVTTEDGTGVVHTAVVYGEDDYNLGLKIGLPVVPLLDSKGLFNNEAPEFIKGIYFKTAEDAIKQDLADRGLMFVKENHTHSYPHCWRCDTQLFYNAISAWFIDIQKVKGRLIELNKKINWYPDHLKFGRFLNILETAPDWNISRNRYWATPLPFWKCANAKCQHVSCIGSVAELKEKATNFSEVYDTDEVAKIDLHKHVMDKIKLACPHCQSEMQRIPEVIDCWVESASMPFAEFHYPFENKETFEQRFPGQYIGEYIAQTRAWFYYMHTIATLLFDNISFENVVCTGTILNDKGEKLSKSKRNYTDPWIIIGEYGVDALRYYLMSSIVMDAENLFFNDREVKEVYNKVINILTNVFDFYQMYATGVDIPCFEAKDLTNILDRWIVTKLNLLIKEVTLQMDNYNTIKATRPIRDFIDELSTWYLRRSRERFKGDDEADKLLALRTLRYVFFGLAKLMAPFTPFIAEYLYQELKGEGGSVHLRAWPTADEEFIDQEVLTEMAVTRKIVELGLAKRAEAGIKIRQPLAKLKTQSTKLKIGDDYLELIKDELNVKEVEQETGEGELTVELDTTLTDELKEEGIVRELIRTINNLRKEMKLTIQDRVKISYHAEDNLLNKVFEKYAEELKKSTLADSLKKSGEKLAEVKINDLTSGLRIDKIIN